MSSLMHAQAKAQQTEQTISMAPQAPGLSEQDLFGNAHAQTSVQADTEAGWLDGLMETPEHGVQAAMGFPLLGLLAGCGQQPTSPDPALEAALVDLEKRSPAFAEAIAKVDRTKLHLGKAGDGSANLPTGEIQIDPDRLADPASLYGTLAHEVGHAVQPEIQWSYNGSMTRQEYIDANTQLNLENEAEALMMELAVREDLLKGETPDGHRRVGLDGGRQACAVRAIQCGRDRQGYDGEGAAALIGTEMPSKTDPGVNDYVDHYGKSHADAWDSSHKAGTP